MKGDFTRSTFNKKRHYSSVRWQQGRVHVDADWNEEMDILAHRDRTTRRDVIGLCGGPAGTDADGNPLAGFLVEVIDGGLHISPGRYYVDGRLLENDADVSILQQPHLPPLPGNTLADVLAPPGTELHAGTYLAYLDVWEWHITALEDPAIREVALGGPDTATRTQMVWQVKLMPAKGKEVNCASKLALWDDVTGSSTGRMAAQAEPSEEETSPCIVPAQAGYRGLENQLYRVEVHRVVSDDEITIKWSRENGSVVTAWLGQDSVNPDRLTVQSTGRDNVLGFAADDWVELTDDVRELRGQPGLLVQIQKPEGNVLILKPGSPPVDFDDFPVNPKVRRWDMPSEVGEISVDLTVADNWIELENGVQVKFEAGTYHVGDYWTIPARTATRNIEWPKDDADPPQPLALPPQGIQHHYCRLALLQLSETEEEGLAWKRLSDCRHLFPPLTEMIRFFHVAGDGQEALPGQPVPQPLQVGVVNGQQPIAGARVQFQVVGGNGRLRAAGESPCSDFTTGGANAVVVETGPDGVAGCCWRLDKETLSQQVEARLLDIDGKPMVDEAGNPLLTPIRFNANLSVAGQVAYDPRNCPDLTAAQTVQQAIDLLCQRPQGGGCCVTVGRGGEFERLEEAIKALLEQGQRDICICLLAGEHETTSPSVSVPLEERDLHIRIHGCGRGSRLILTDKPWLFRGVKSVILKDLAIELAFQVNNEEGALSFQRCAEVVITGSRIRGLTQKGPLVSIRDADQVRVRDNLFEASRFESLNLPQRVFKGAQADFLAALYALPTQGAFRWAEFRKQANESARQLAGLNRNQQQRLGRRIQRTLGDNQLRASMSRGEFFNLTRLATELNAGAMEPAVAFDLLLDIRRAAIKSRPGLALVLGQPLPGQELPEGEMGVLDADDLLVLEGNEIAGVISLYGLPAPADFIAKIFNQNFLKRLEGQLKERQITLTGLLGTLQVRGNQLVQIAVARDIVEQLQVPAGGRRALFNLFGRCLMSDNVIEGATSALVIQHLAMTANEFTLMALPASFGLAVNATAIPRTVAIVVADSSIYVGNHGRQQNVVLRDVSQVNSQAANLEITIS